MELNCGDGSIKFKDEGSQIIIPSEDVTQNQELQAFFTDIVNHNKDDNPGDLPSVYYVDDDTLEYFVTINKIKYTLSYDIFTKNFTVGKSNKNENDKYVFFDFNNSSIFDKFTSLNNLLSLYIDDIMSDYIYSVDDPNY